MPSLCHHYATIVWGIQPWPASWRFSPKAKVKNWTNSLTVRSWFRQQKRLRHSNSVAKLSKLAKAQTLAKVGQGPTTPVIGKRSIHWSIMIYYDLLWSIMIYWRFQWHVVVWFQIGNQENLMLWTKMFSKHLKTIQNLRFPELSASICRILRWWSKPIAFKETVPSPPGSRYRKTAAIRASKREPFFV